MNICTVSQLNKNNWKFQLLRKDVLWQASQRLIFDDNFYFSQRFKDKNSSQQYTVATHNLELYYNCIS